ncbi:MAG: zinc ribbon domain-containing protein, partial [Anaerolineae bacterium]|nr:zinc ribbon domain-containing protein [Anaerolineae bacterium]
MEARVVPLVCPQCGSTNNVSERELAFGVEFVCQYCGTTSVLIANQQLHIRRPGELVCSRCGWVVEQTERFCGNCGRLLRLTRVCPNCNATISVNDKYCISCGINIKHFEEDLPGIQEAERVQSIQTVGFIVLMIINTFAKLSGETVRLANANAAKSSQASPDT